MVLPVVSTLIAVSIVAWEVWTHCHLGKKLAAARLCVHSLYLPTTHVTVAPNQVGHIIPVNDHLKLIRHTSGRIAYLTLPPPLRPRPPMPQMLKTLLLTFFTL